MNFLVPCFIGEGPQILGRGLQNRTDFPSRAKVPRRLAAGARRSRGEKKEKMEQKKRNIWSKTYDRRELIIIIITTCWVFLSGYKATVINHPGVFGAAGDTFTLTCNKSTGDPVSWWYRSSPGARPEHISLGGPTINGWAERCRIDGDDLVFEKLQLNDTGEYTCLEKAGQGVRHVMFLNVSGNLRSEAWFTDVIIRFILWYVLGPSQHKS